VLVFRTCFTYLLVHRPTKTVVYLSKYTYYLHIKKIDLLDQPTLASLRHL
jgi:hypothetical protein